MEGTVLLYFLLQELSTGLYLSSSAGELAITSNPRSKTVVVGSSSLVSGLNMFLVTATRFCVPPPPLALVEDFCHSLKLREGKRVSCPCTETEPPTKYCLVSSRSLRKQEILLCVEVITVILGV